MQLFQSNFFELNDSTVELKLSELDSIISDREIKKLKNKSNLCGKWLIVNGNFTKSDQMISNSGYYLRL